MYDSYDDCEMSIPKHEGLPTFLPCRRYLEYEETASLDRQAALTHCRLRLNRSAHHESHSRKERQGRHAVAAQERSWCPI